MKVDKKFGDRISIDWVDACEMPGWKSLSEAIKVPDEIFCRTSGYFLNQTKDFITIAHTIGLSEKNDVTGVFHIPKRWIRGVK